MSKSQRSDCCSQCGAELAGPFCSQCGAVRSDAIAPTEPDSGEALPVRIPIPETATVQAWQIAEFRGHGWSVLRDDGPTVLMVKGSLEEYEAALASRRKLTPAARKAILEAEIQRYVGRGFKVVSRTDTTAQLVKPKAFSCLWALVWLLLLIGIIFYAIYYLSKQDEQVYLSIDEYGEIVAR